MSWVSYLWLKKNEISMSLQSVQNVCTLYELPIQRSSHEGSAVGHDCGAVASSNTDPGLPACASMLLEHKPDNMIKVGGDVVI